SSPAGRIRNGAPASSGRCRSRSHPLPRARRRSPGPRPASRPRRARPSRALHSHREPIASRASMLARQNRGMEPAIRAPRPEEFDRLRDIERAAGVLFAEAGMPEVAAHEPEPAYVLAHYADAGRAWVGALDDVPVGYALVNIVDGNAHLEQLSVHPD